MISTLSITLAQINPVMGDLRGNCDKILKIWAEESCDLIVFPELVTCGYPPEDLVLKPFFLEKIEELVEELIQKSRSLKPAIVLSTPWRIDGRTYSAAHVIAEGKIVGTTLKHSLPNYGVFDERRVFESGPLPVPIEFQGVKLGVIVCEDLWVPEPSINLKTHGAEILLSPNGSPFAADKHARRIEIAKARVQETGLSLAYVNQVGGQDELVFDGGSFVMDASGAVTAQGAFFEEECFPMTRTSLLPLPKKDELIYEALQLGLHDYIEKNGFPGIVLGLSGGIDSALAAAIAVDAIGPSRVHAIMMPSEYTSQDSLDDAEELAKNLGIRYDVISIKDIFKMFEKTLEDYMGHDITHQNVQSRIRGLMLMAVSNATGKMVLSTGNKSEMAVGYATLYGDMNGGFNVLKDVYKTQVYDLAHWRGNIPERILTKVPTAELKYNQTDQDSLPPYDQLDAILALLIEDELSVDQIVSEGFAREMIVKIWHMVDRAEYKRRQAPPGAKITRRSFGRERRYPMTNRFSAIVK